MNKVINMRDEIMARLTEEQLEKIKQKYDVDRIWSWSRIEKFMNSPYEYCLKYIKEVPEDRQDSCYTTLGTICHTALDDFYENKIPYGGMIDSYNDGYLTAIILADLKFNRCDEEKNKSIGEKYNQNLQHFFQNHNIYQHKLTIERPIMANINDNIFVGYIDAMYKDENGDYYIIDFKSSSMYTGHILEEHSGQLTLYSIGLNQLGIPLDKIHAGFNFLKYVTIQYEQKNGAIKNRNVERCKIGESLQANAKTWLKHFDYEPDEYLKLLLDTNDIKCLPEEIQEKYKISDCHVYIDLKPDKLQHWVDLITKTIKDIKLREKDYEKTGSDACFWDTDESVEKQSYYFANLCSYSRQIHKPYDNFLIKQEELKNENILVSNINNQDICNIKEVDLSWLDNII